MAAASLLPAGCGQPAARRPNVLLIVIDTLRADHLSAYGYPWPTSPRLDALAERGALFLDCTAQGSWTASSMVSLMTGQPIFQTVYRIPDVMPVLPERFAGAGYRTGAFVANSVLSEQAGFARGIESWDVRQELTRKWTAQDVNSRALDFLFEPDERPFFLWLHYLDTHAPYTPDERPWTRAPEEVFADWERQAIAAMIEGAPAEERAALAEQLDELAAEVDGYDAEIRQLDDRIGELLFVLEKRGQLRDTIVAVVSDHGETLFQRPEHPDRIATMRDWRARRGEPMRLADYVKREHYYWTYEELIRTPWIVAGPGIAPAQRIGALVSNLDLAPTLLGLAGLPVPPGGAGRDLSRALSGAEAVPSAPWVTSTGDLELAAKLPGGRKLSIPVPDAAARHGLSPRLYDLSSDPLERHPLPLDEEARALVERLNAASEADPFAEWQGQDIDPETLERLKELGYVR